MYGEGEVFKRSVARTNKLHCSDCGRKIIKGEDVIFRLDLVNEKMKDAYCNKCGENYEMEVIMDTQHPMDLED